MPFLIYPLVAGQQLKNAQTIIRPDDTDSLSNGDLVKLWDVVFTWDNYCVPESRLAEWRQECDSLTDDALAELFDNTPDFGIHGIDLLAAVERAAGSDANVACKRFLSTVAQNPPADIMASTSNLLTAQRFFWDNSFAILQSLLHMSLAGGFASPRITRVLRETSYLVPPTITAQDAADSAREHTFTRLLETVQFVLDVMGGIPPDATYPSPSSHHGNLAPHQPGWTSAVQVRLLHGVARRRARARSQRSEVPLNEQDMLATLASFSVAPIWSLERMSPRLLRPSQCEREAFVAAWRHIGWYMGISPDLLRTHFSCYEAGAKLLATAGLTSLLPEDGEDNFIPPTMSLLRSIANRPPLQSAIEFHCAFARFLLDDALADHLSIPRTSFSSRIRLWIGMIALQGTVWFGCLWRRDWREQRSRIFRHALPRVVRNHLGMRRTTFRARQPGKWEFSGDVRAAETTGPPDYVGGARMACDWRWLMWEMGAVCAVAGAVAIGLSVGTIRLLS